MKETRRATLARDIEARRRQEELWKLSEEIRKEDERVEELAGWSPHEEDSRLCSRARSVVVFQG